MKGYKHSNGRITARGSDGRFKKATFSDAFGIQPNIERLICGKCGHGKKGDFIPLIETGYCPLCNNQEGHIKHKDYAHGLIGLQFWFITDIWEAFCAVPVTVKSVSDKGKITLEWQDDIESCLGEYQIIDLTQLYETRAEAEREITTQRHEGAENER